MEFMEIIWLAVIIGCVLIETLSVQMVCIWFAAAALPAFFCSLFGAPLWLQIALFIVSAAVLLFFTRPIVSRLMNRPRERTNADRVIGKLAVVMEEIDNEAARGVVKIGGQIWSARSAADCVIPVGARVKIHSIEGVRVIVNEVTDTHAEFKEVTQCRL